MARMRYLKPEFWTDSKVVAMSPFARLLFAGSWNFACDAGHLDDDATALKLRVLPADQVDANELLAEVINSGRILRKTLPDGRTYLHVVKLADHQKVESRWGSRCPYCAALSAVEPERPQVRAGSTVAAETSTDSGDSLPNSPNLSEPLPISPQDGMGGDGKNSQRESSPRKRGPRRRPETPLPDDWKPTDDHRRQSAELGLDVRRAAQRFRDHAQANDRRQRDWNAAFRLWLDREVDYGGTSASSGKPLPDGTVDADAILGRDVWQLPTPPRNLQPGTQAYTAWARTTTEDHRAERQKLAREELARRSA